MRITKRIAKAFCTTREAADLLGISVRTAQLWCDSGLLDAWKTIGGHRRITRASIGRLLRIAETVVPAGSTWQPPSVRLFPSRPASQQEDEIGNRFRVLVVEDDEGLRRLYAFRLQRWTIRPVVETVSNVHEALARLASCNPDMLIIDLNVPGPNGLHLLRSIREAARPAISVIAVVSGLSRDEIERQGGVPAGIPVFPKPVPFQKLAALAEEATARRDAPDGDSTEWPKAGRACAYMTRDPELPDVLITGDSSTVSSKNSA